jgi:hypothetical protein
MNILRKLKISKLTTVKFSETEKEILELCERKLRYLSGYVYNDTTVYTNPCNEFIFEAQHRNKKLYVNKECFWDVIEKKLSYDETQKLLSHLIKSKYEHYASFYAMPKY